MGTTHTYRYIKVPSKPSTSIKFTACLSFPMDTNTVFTISTSDISEIALVGTRIDLYYLKYKVNGNILTLSEQGSAGTTNLKNVSKSGNKITAWQTVSGGYICVLGYLPN